MAKRSVVWTETAAKQRRFILEYWTLHNGSPIYSKKLIRLITSRIKIILKHPESFKIADYPNTRESAMGHFSIFYKVTDQQLIVTAFWDNRQDPKQLQKMLIEKNGV
jgi:plasmid stabilization system protein ParE